MTSDQERAAPAQQPVADETGWLIELKPSVVQTPAWFQFSCDDDWTTDAFKAVRFARKEDAEQVIAYYGWTEAFASEHMWHSPREHDWHERFDLTCCRNCGIVKRADGKNKPCKGSVKVGPRGGSPSEPELRAEIVRLQAEVERLTPLAVAYDYLEAPDAVDWKSRVEALSAEVGEPVGRFKQYRRNLIKAGALILAEIERLDRRQIREDGANG